MSAVARRVFLFFLSLPPVRRKVDLELQTVEDKMDSELVIRNDKSIEYFKSIPEHGLSETKVLQELMHHSELKHSDWQDGRVSGAVYHGGDDIIDLQSKAFQINCVANQLHPDVFPAVRKMESEVVEMVLRLFHGDEKSCGTTTSGGTESLLLACLSAREYGRKFKGITHPEMIAPETVHAGVEKAAYYFGIKLHKAPVDPVSYKVNISSVNRLINGNTVLLVGSAPNFPHGIIDDIEELSRLAVRNSTLLHVDCCLGSFIVSYMERAGFEIPKFDFQLDGVTSISCDTHKYGFAPKGSSIIMYRNSEIRQCQYYISTDWIGGLYGSPTLAGSRPGALMAGCWATLIRIGDDGYIQSCKDIVGASRRIKAAIDKEIDELQVIGNPIGSVVAFKSDVVNVYSLGDALSKKGWHLSTLQKPAALHIAVTRLTVPVVDELVRDLKETVEEVKGSSLPTGDTAAVYGVAGSVKTTSVVDRVIVAFLDTLYKT